MATEEEKAAAKAAKEEEKAAAKAANSSDPITVYHRDHRGRATSRVFSKDVHGDDFAKLAEQFKATNATRIIADEDEGKAAIEEAARLDAEERAKADTTKATVR